ncbi:metallophosphoesterase [Paucilactobacillus suebicus]|uniref:Diadenosine tetraphosphatase-like protein n=1 Tax=Paucilactobacillus suebicus DSM 5007 = KCTC 3549 TaxID=1423807 RepID=A0A0R1VY07_9LACO|nr:metallophosphoesterase [Paucilactobacillus suebicus]KRM10568.1 diadenosine tetraphosphatase-like protein [Paucilactobacillus suebicus DSM 5007 = KCTC 3549]
MNYTFIGDVHSAADDLVAVLDDDTIQSSKIVFLGDYIDGVSERYVDGNTIPMLLEPLRVLDIIMDRVNQCGDVALLGNHDNFWVQTANFDEIEYQTWKLNGGVLTWRNLGIHSTNLAGVANALNDQQLGIYTKFLAQLPIVWEANQLFAVHAGVRWGKGLGQQAKNDLLWIRNDYFFDGEASSDNWHHNDLGKVIVSGHTPVQFLNGIGFIKMQADKNDVPRYLIDAGSRSGAENGGIFALTLDEVGNVVQKRFIVNHEPMNV